MEMKKNNPASRSGQAMIELMLGIILILILLTGNELFQFVASAQTNMDGKIRGNTGFLAMSPLTEEDTPSYIVNWTPGPDGQRFTADDQTVPFPGGVNAISTIAADSVAHVTDWNQIGSLAYPCSLEALGQLPTPLMSLGFVGTSQTTIVPVSEAAQGLFYGNANATVQESVWIPILNGLY